MTVYRLIRILHHLGIKVPSDLWQLKGNYFSNSNNTWIPIVQMDIFHVIRALAKTQRPKRKEEDDNEYRRYG